jgi:hypothetical protein
MEPNEEIKYVDPRQPDLSNDTDKVKETYELLVKIKSNYKLMSPEEQERMDQLAALAFED